MSTKKTLRVRRLRECLLKKTLRLSNEGRGVFITDFSEGPGRQFFPPYLVSLRKPRFAKGNPSFSLANLDFPKACCCTDSPEGYLSGEFY